MRRPGVRSLAGGAAGIAAGVIGGIALSALPAAGLERAAGEPIIDATHVPPALTLPGEAVRVRFAIVCTPRPNGEPCDGEGDLFIRGAQSGAFERIPLRRGEDSSEGRYYADIPFRDGFSYYAVLRDRTTGASITVPSGGAAAPQRSFSLSDPVTVDLGAHVFAHTRRPDARVVEAAWGSERGRVGRAGTRELGFVGPASFDVESDGTVAVLDQVNGRVERWGKGVAETVPVEVSGGLADFAVEPDGTFDVLEPPNRVSAAPLLRSFRKDGTPKWAQPLSDRTWAKLGVGPTGPVVQQQPSEQWLPAAENGRALGRGAQAARGRPGKPVAGGHELVVDRVGEAELRLAEVAGNSVIRAWRVTSATPLGEVQLAEPSGARLVVALKTYTEKQAEYVVLVLGRGGLEQRFSVEAAEWAESAPLARFRLARGSLYQLGSTPTGAFVDSFDLEVSS
jgi:hypothetical protein